MYGPPAVSFPVGRSRWHGALLVGLCLLAGLASGGLFLFASDNMAPWMAAVHLLLTVVLAALAALQWGRSPQGRLRWDGEQWWWADAPVPRLRCVLDAQAVVLLALELGARRPVWLWLERRQGPATAWRALRRALVHAGHADPRTPEPAHEALP